MCAACHSSCQPVFLLGGAGLPGDRAVRGLCPQQVCVPRSHLCIRALICWPCVCHFILASAFCHFRVACLLPLVCGIVRPRSPRCTGAGSQPRHTSTECHPVAVLFQEPAQGMGLLRGPVLDGGRERGRGCSPGGWGPCGLGGGLPPGAQAAGVGADCVYAPHAPSPLASRSWLPPLRSAVCTESCRPQPGTAQGAPQTLPTASPHRGWCGGPCRRRANVRRRLSPSPLPFSQKEPLLRSLGAW